MSSLHYAFSRTLVFCSFLFIAVYFGERRGLTQEASSTAEALRSMGDEDLLRSVEADALPINASRKTYGCIAGEVRRRQSPAMTLRLIDLYRRIEPSDPMVTSWRETFWRNNDIQCTFVSPAQKLICMIDDQQTAEGWTFLINLLNSASPVIVSSALGRFAGQHTAEFHAKGDELRAIYERLLADETPIVRWSAARALWHTDVHSDEVLAALEARLPAETHESVRSMLTSAIRELQDLKKGWDLLALLKSKDSDERQRGAAGLRTDPSVIAQWPCFRRAVIEELRRLKVVVWDEALQQAVAKTLERYEACDKSVQESHLIDSGEK